MNAPLEVKLSDTSQPDARQQIAPEEWVATHGDYLFRHALARTGRPEVAEDMVQETFLAAWKSAHRFAGRASERTWLLRILRNKIADHYRRQRSEIVASDVDALAQFEEQQFKQTSLGGHAWKAGNVPATWKDARKSLEQAEFWEVLQNCTHKLPAMTARVFLMRELDGLESPTICRELNIKPSHLFVMLHRARLALRRCLELNWFSDRATGK
jgi:RNA polymerase sigma-70 factor (TIGR02943 family)